MQRDSDEKIRLDEADPAPAADEVVARGVRRFDSTGRLGKAVRTPQGGYRIPAVLTRAGVFEYRNDDGSKRTEYRSLEEVKKSLPSLRGATVTILHPKDKLVGPSNYRRVNVGHVGDELRMDGTEVHGEVIVNDAEAIALVDAGQLEDLSLGYVQDMVRKDGVAPEDGKTYQFSQRNIVNNHASLHPKGRGRAGVARLRLDAQGDEIDPYEQPHQERATMKIRLDGKDIDISDGELARAIGAELAQRDNAVATAKGAADGAKERLDAVTKELEAAKAAAAKATDPKAIEAMVKEHIRLDRACLRRLGADFASKLEGMTPRQKREAFIANGRDEVAAQLKDKPDLYVEARFDAIEEEVVLRADAIESDLGVLSGAGRIREDAQPVRGKHDPKKARAALYAATERMHETRSDRDDEADTN